MIVVLVIFVVLVRRGIIHPRERVSKIRRAVSQKVGKSKVPQVIYSNDSVTSRPKKSMKDHTAEVCIL